MTGGGDPFDFDDDDKTIIQGPNKRPAAPARTSAPADDIFASAVDGEKTVIFGGAADPARTREQAPPRKEAPMEARPRPSLAAAAGEKSVAANALGSGEIESDNPLIAAGARLLAFAGVLRNTASHNDISGLREKIVNALSVYEDDARVRGAAAKDIQLGHYALCALIDDVVMATPWGGGNVWAKRSLTSAFHHDVDAGDRLLELAQRLEQSPSQHPDVLELVYVALSLGFEGRLRLDARGPARHQQVRAGLFNALRERRGAYERSLSRLWRGAETGHKPLVRRIPAWVYWSAFAFLGFIIFSTLHFLLNARAQNAFAALAETSPPQLAAPENTYTPEPIPDDREDRIREILKPDIDAGRVVVEDKGNSIEIRIATTEASEVFASGRDDLKSAYNGTMERIIEASNVTIGPVEIRGYTDGEPISTPRFASNVELSEARAEYVRKRLAETAENPGRFSAEGRGEEDPIGDNATAEGRRENRRVEITLMKAVGVEYDGR